MELFSEMFSYAFIVRALVVGILVSLCASLLGVSLVLKRYSMIGDGLSHVGFGSLAAASAFHIAPLAVSVPVTVIAAFVLLRVSENSKIKGDAGIALISASFMAIGVIIISLTSGMNVDVCNYMFGSILAMSKSDVVLSVILSLSVLSLFVVFYNKIFAVTFDESFACATGIKTSAYNAIVAILTAITITLGMRIMGALLISSLIIFPTLSSMRILKTFKGVIIGSASISLICFFAGISMSYVYSTPAGASIVIVNMIVFLLFSTINFLMSKRKFIAKLCVFALLFLFTSNVFAQPQRQKKIIELKDKFFIAQISDIYLNTKSYLGKIIKYQGIFKEEIDENGKADAHYVVRYGPGCCGNDMTVGFEVIYNGQYPKNNDWVEIQGHLKESEKDGFPTLCLKLLSIEILEKRGKEQVTN
jgi:zinc transport system permease protein